jgi:hypothetical protein
MNGSVHFSTRAGATVTLAKPQAATGFAFVSTVGPDRGKALISVDGQPAVSVDLYAPTAQPAQVVWSVAGLTPGVNHNVVVTVTNTKSTVSTGTRVDYDAILTLR